MTKQQELISLTEAAALLGLTRQGVHWLLGQGQLKAIMIGHQLALSRTAVERLKAQRQEEALANR